MHDTITVTQFFAFQWKPVVVYHGNSFKMLGHHHFPVNCALQSIKRLRLGYKFWTVLVYAK